MRRAVEIRVCILGCGNTSVSDDFYAEHLRREAEARAAERKDLATLRSQVLALARAVGATKITARHEGGGGSVMDEIYVEPDTADAPLQATPLPRPAQHWSAGARVCETSLAQTPVHDCVRDMLTTLPTHHVGSWRDVYGLPLGCSEFSGERLNKEVKRRADVVGIFPNEASIIRLIGAAPFEQHDEWQTSSRYMMVEAFAHIDKGEIDPILSISTKAA